MKHKAAAALLVLFLVFQLNASGQKPQLFTSESGLPNSKINAVCQDNDGFIWIGTEDGLARFDGIHFVPFKVKSSIPDEQESNIVLRMLEDSRGTTWIGTSQGLQIYDKASDSFHRFDLHDSDNPDSRQYIQGIMEIQEAGGKSSLLVSASQHGIYVIDTETLEIDNKKRERFNQIAGSKYTFRMFFDSRSRLWLASESGGMIVIQKDSFTEYALNWDNETDSISDEILVYSFAEDEDTGNILIGTSNHGILIYEAQKNCIRRAHDGSARNCKVMSLLQDNRYHRAGDRLFLVGTENNGLNIFDLASESIRKAYYFNIPYSTESWKVHSLMEDRQGNIWAGVYQTGLLLIPQSLFGFYSKSFSREMSPGSIGSCVTSIIEDPADGSTWIGTDGGGLFKMDIRNNVTNYSESNSGLLNDSVMSLAIDKRGTLWIATYLDGIMTFSHNTGFKPLNDNSRIGTNKVFCLVYDDKNDIIYAGTHGNGLCIIDASTGHLIKTISESRNKWINTLFIDNDGTLWIGTNNGPMYYNPSSQRLFLYDIKPEISIARISAIAQDGAGGIWIGTDNGLISIKNSGEDLTWYTVENGLSHNSVHGLLEDNGKNVWVSTSDGLSRINTVTGSISRYYDSDGLQGNEFITNAVFKNKNGRLYFGGNNGMSYFYPQNVGRKNHPVPQVFFTRLIVGEGEVINNKSSENDYLDSYITSASRITLPYSNNAFAIQYSAPEFSNPKRIKYSYKLDKFDKDWKDGTFFNDAIYTNLPHGHYTLTVKASFEGQDEEYSTKSIQIRILPPAALSVWAILLYILLGIGLIALLTDYVQNIIKHKKEKEESDIKEMKLKMFTNLSHEIRTPLTLVMSPLKRLRETEKDDNKKDLYNLMYRNSLRILRLVNQVMDIQKIDNGQMRMHFRETDIVYFIKDIMKSFENMAVNREINFSMHSKDEVTNLWVDQSSFDKIIFNVLSNAFKHTPEGGNITIDVSGPMENESSGIDGIAGYIEISINNSDSHIKESDLDKIFDRYYQSNIYDANTGFGVGLNLAKELVVLHKGQIYAKNTDDGVSFTIKLPMGNVHLKEESLVRNGNNTGLYNKAVYQENMIESVEDLETVTITSGEDKDLKSKKSVIFVDDNIEMLKYVKMELKDFFNIEIFDNVKDAWASITTKQPDAVVTDLIMSTETEGAEFCEKIKHNPGTNLIPVLILTSKTDEESVQKCTECGADRYLTKPISTKLLKSTIMQTITTRDTIKNKYSSEVEYDYNDVKISSSDDRLLSKVIESIKTNIDNPDYGVEDLSKDVGMSRVHMNRKLKECISLSPSNLIKSIRLKQAAYLLANNKVNISEVAYRVGFSTHSYFSSSFHDYFGLTPKEFVARYSNDKDNETLKKLLEL